MNPNDPEGDGEAGDGPAKSSRTPLANALLAAAVVAGGSLPVYLTGAMFVQLSVDLAFGAAGLGVVVGAYRGATALGAVPLGRLADRVRPDRSLRVSLLLSALAMIGIASVATNFTHLFAFLLLSGLAYALGQTSVNVFLSTAVPPHRQGMALGIKQAAIPLSGMLAGPGGPGARTDPRLAQCLLDLRRGRDPRAVRGAELRRRPETVERRGRQGSHAAAPDAGARCGSRLRYRCQLEYDRVPRRLGRIHRDRSRASGPPPRRRQRGIDHRSDRRGVARRSLPVGSAPSDRRHARCRCPRAIC